MGQNKNSKSEFICQNCNSVMDVKMIDSNKSFSKKELLTMMDTEDFSDMLATDMSYLEVFCYCNNPLLSINDSLLLNEIDYWKYAEPQFLDIAQPVA